MPATRRRRIVKRVVMALAGVALLPVWYAGSWLAVSRAASKGMIGNSTTFHVRPVFAPLIWYCDSDMPGGTALSKLWWAATDQPVFYIGPPRPEINLRPAEH